MQISGVDGQGCVLYVEDHQISGAVLESLNSLLSCGEVLVFFKPEELGPMLEPVKAAMQDLNTFFRTTYECFVYRVRQNLKILVSMDPTHPTFQLRCEANPALYNRCCILWFGEWKTSSLYEVPGRLLPDYFGSTAQDETSADTLRDHAVAIHNACKERGATPRDFISFLECYKVLYESKAGALEKKVNDLEGGLAKLQEAAKTVDELSAEAEMQRAELKKKQQAADDSMDEITRALSKASDTKKRDGGSSRGVEGGRRKHEKA